MLEVLESVILVLLV